MSNQDTIYNLLNALKEGAQEAGTLALGAVGIACEEAERLTGAVRLRCQAAQIEGKMDERLMEAGKMVYATHTGSPTESGELLAKLREIDSLKAELDALNESLGRTGAVCPDCGEAAREGDRFCRNCGRSLFS